MQLETRATVEELFKPNSDIGADADIVVTFDASPEEPQTRDYPGCPAVVELVGWAIEHYTLYDADGNPTEEGPQARTPAWLLKEVDGWVESNDQLLIDQACEEDADADEAAFEDYYDRKREDY
jgi:hypothetical protein